jgi:mRNA interferase RelE/StbE
LAWTIEYSDTARKQLSKIDRQIARRIPDYMDARIADAGNPRSDGRHLKGPLGGLWRYRIGDYRVICEIGDGRLRILVVRIAHRRDVYR